MLRLFQSSNPFTIFLYFIFSAALQLHYFLSPPSFVTDYPALTAHLVMDQLFHVQDAPIHIIIGIHTLIVALQGLLISFLIQSYKIFQKSSLLPGAVFVLITSWFPETGMISPEIIACILMTPALFKIFSSYNKTKIDSTLFDTGLIGAVASLFYFPVIVFCAFGIFAIIRLRSTSFREFIVYLSGVIVIYFLAFTAYFWFHLLPEFSKQFYLPLALPSINGLFTTTLIIRLILLGSLFIVSLWFLNEKFSSNIVQIRKYFGSFINLFIFCIFMLFFSSQLSIGNMYFLFVPSSVFISYYFAQTKNRLYAELIFWGMIGTAIIFQYVNFA